MEENRGCFRRKQLIIPWLNKFKRYKLILKAKILNLQCQDPILQN